MCHVLIHLARELGSGDAALRADRYKLPDALLDSAFLRCPHARCELLFLLEAANLSQTRPDHCMALSRFAETLVGAFPGLAARHSRREFVGEPLHDEIAAGAQSCYCLLFVLERLVTETPGGGALGAACARYQAAAVRQPHTAER